MFEGRGEEKENYPLEITYMMLLLLWISYLISRFLVVVVAARYRFS
jgi:hypothetical protein